jgi:hypothetical protein
MIRRIEEQHLTRKRSLHSIYLRTLAALRQRALG